MTNLNERYFVVAKTAKNKAMKLHSEHATVEGAEIEGMATTYPDFTVLRGDKLAALSGPEIVAMHNALVEKEARVERFADRAVGISRLLRAFEAMPPETAKAIAQRDQIVPEQKQDATQTAPAAGVAVDEIWPDAPADNQERKVKTKKVKVAKVAVDDKRKIKLAPKSKAEGKIWHKGSLRSKAYEWLAEQTGTIFYKDALVALAKKLSVPQATVRGLLVKIAELKLLEIGE